MHEMASVKERYCLGGERREEEKGQIVGTSSQNF
jgi:hypothetical protein